MMLGFLLILSLFLRESLTPLSLSLHLPLTSSISPLYLIPWMGSRISRHLSKRKKKLEREEEEGRVGIDQMKERKKRNWKQGAHLQFKYKNFPQFVCYLFIFPSIFFSLFLSFFHSDYFVPSFSVHFFSFTFIFHFLDRKALSLILFLFSLSLFSHLKESKSASN